MSVIISNIRIGIDDPDELAIEKAKKKLSVKDSRISSIHVYKRSLDARRRKHTGFVLSVLAQLDGDEERLVQRIDDPSVVYKPNASGNNRMHSAGASDCCGRDGARWAVCRIHSGTQWILPFGDRAWRTN